MVLQGPSEAASVDSSTRGEEEMDPHQTFEGGVGVKDTELQEVLKSRVSILGASRGIPESLTSARPLGRRPW